MVFNLGKDNACIDCKLKAISGIENLEIDYIQFRKSSVAKIADIMKNGVKRDNQELVVDSIIIKKSEFEKFKDKRYKADFRALMDIGNHTLMAIEFTLGNIDISFNWKHVKYDSDDVYISLANMIVYPHGVNSFRIIED